jgi:hypothetical protein
MARMKDQQEYQSRKNDERGYEPGQDILTTNILGPQYFRNEQFALDNLEIVSEYADYRVAGYSAERAFLRVFGTDYADLYLDRRIEALEHNIVYRKVFAEKFGQTQPSQMWDAKMAVYELLSLANNGMTKCSTKLAAIKELNILLGVTVVDDKGITRAGSSLDDFYKNSHAAKQAAETGRHPEPGTDAARAYVEDSDEIGGS